MVASLYNGGETEFEMSLLAGGDWRVEGGREREGMLVEIFCLHTASTAQLPSRHGPSGGEEGGPGSLGVLRYN